MRRTLLACRSGLTGAAAVLLLAACTGGGSEEDTAATSPTETTASATETTAEGADSQFCTEASALVQGLEPALRGQTDPATLAPVLEQAATDVRAIEAPAEIEEDWAALADGLEDFAAAFRTVDQTNPESVATFQATIQQIQGRVTSSGNNVQNYLAEECGFEPDATESAAPTS